jgi:hypothetical protein
VATDILCPMRFGRLAFLLALFGFGCGNSGDGGTTPGSGGHAGDAAAGSSGTGALGGSGGASGGGGSGGGGASGSGASGGSAGAGGGAAGAGGGKSCGGPDEPVDPGGNYLWSDDFDRYTDVDSMGACNAGAVYGIRTQYNTGDCNAPADPKYQLLTPGRNGSGHALRGVYQPDPNHNQQSLAWLSPWGGTIAFGGSIVIRFTMRVGAGQSYAPQGGKFFEVWWDSGPTQRIQWGVIDKFASVLGSNPGNTVIRTAQPVGPYWSDINDGSWHCVTLLFKANTFSTYVNTSGIESSTEQYDGTSSRDGRVAMWIDGSKILDYSQATVGVTPPGGTNPWCYQGDVDMIPAVTVNHFQFPEVANGTDGGMTIDHDDLLVWAGD